MTELPSGWTRPPLGEVAHITAKLVDPADHPGMPHIAPNHIEGGTGRLLPYRTVSEDAVTSPKYRFRAGEVLYSKIRPYLAKATLATFDGLCSADMYPLMTDTDPRYLAYWLISSTFTALAANEQGRSLLPRINREALFRIPIPLAPPAEQRRIVEAIEEQFSRMDSSLQSLRRARRGLRALRSSTLNTVFGGAGPLRAIGDVCARPQYGWTTRSLIKADTARLLRITDIQDGSVDWNIVPHCEEEPDDLARFLLQSGDLVVARSGATVGKTFLLQNPPPAVFASYLIRLRPMETLLPEYLAWFCQTPAYWNQISRASSGMAQPNVNGRKLATIELPVPSIKLQEEALATIHHSISILDAMEEAAGHAMRGAEALRRAVLRAAFGGKLLRETPPRKPVAGILARIPFRSRA